MNYLDIWKTVSDYRLLQHDDTLKITTISMSRVVFLRETD